MWLLIKTVIKRALEIKVSGPRGYRGRLLDFGAGVALIKTSIKRALGIKVSEPGCSMGEIPESEAGVASTLNCS